MSPPKNNSATVRELDRRDDRIELRIESLESRLDARFQGLDARIDALPALVAEAMRASQPTPVPDVVDVSAGPLKLKGGKLAVVLAIVLSIVGGGAWVLAQWGRPVSAPVTAPRTS